MTSKEFNIKYKKYLEKDFYGLVILSKNVVSYLDREFEKEIKENKHFKYLQIKLKWSSARVYTSNKIKNVIWEKEINSILRKEHEEIVKFNSQK